MLELLTSLAAALVSPALPDRPSHLSHEEAAPVQDTRALGRVPHRTVRTGTVRSLAADRIPTRRLAHEPSSTRTDSRI